MLRGAASALLGVGCCSTPLLLGLIGGYPVGAGCIGAMARRGECTREEGERMLCFCCNTGPSFLAMGVGGAMLGSVRAVFPVRGRAAFLPDMALVGAVLLGLQSYAAALSAGGVLRWYMPGSAFLCAFGAERLLRPALQALEQGLFWLAAGPLRLARRALQPLAAARKNRVEQARARRAQKRSAKKPKKNLPSTRRLLYNSNVSK